MFGSVKVQKAKLLNSLCVIEAKDEEGRLSVVDKEELCKLRSDLILILSQEEAMWKQRSKERWIEEGDQNTSYFHKVSSGRKRRNFIKEVEVDGFLCSGEAEVTSGSTSFFKSLFSRSTESSCDCD